ncbi:MAG: hypothetical protein A2X46_04860 [Lentisphaerae bacterium GWF2_57_35]|nr:MAG: hypothetical protein A2X46_04860 [Lentisphaerae bacterium GWF2_57_35]
MKEREIRARSITKNAIALTGLQVTAIDFHRNSLLNHIHIDNNTGLAFNAHHNPFQSLKSTTGHTYGFACLQIGKNLNHIAQRECLSNLVELLK